MGRVGVAVGVRVREGEGEGASTYYNAKLRLFYISDTTI